MSRWLTLTTTMSLRRARLLPSYQAELADPKEKAPPCSQTMTGRFALSSAGVQTFSVRQSSPTGRLSRTPQSVASSGRCAPAPAWGDLPA